METLAVLFQVKIWEVDSGAADNSRQSSSTEPPDSLCVLLPNRTKEDKTLISVMAEMALVPVEADEGQ